MAGNTNSGQRKDKVWRDALKLAVHRQAEGLDPRPLLAQIAEKVVSLALEGDMQAIKEIGDRIDGKPLQQTENTTEITVTHVDARKRLAGKLDAVIEPRPAPEASKLTH